MQIIDLIKNESLGERRRILVAAVISGIANAVVLGTINTAAKQVEEGLNFRYFLMFASAMSLYIICLKYSQNSSLLLFERMIHKMTTRLSRKLETTELNVMEEIGRATIYNRLTKETEIIALSQQPIVTSLQAAVVLLFASIYTFILSPVSFVLIFVMHAIIVVIFMKHDRGMKGVLQQATDKGIELIDKIINLLDGFKQVKMRKRLGSDLLDDIEFISKQTSDYRVKAGKLLNTNIVLGNSLTLSVLAAIVFILPRFISAHHEVIYQLVAIVLFIFGPLGSIVTSIPAIEKASIAAENIKNLEEQLDQKMSTLNLPSKPLEGNRFASFKTIEFNAVEYAYRDKSGQEMFHLGPLNFKIEKGKILFIVGGNGTGKSTVLKLLASLYEADSGSIRVDGLAIDKSNTQEFRELFSIIFADFHIFQKLYGLDPVSRETVLGMLKDMELSDRTSFDGECFSDLNLSTGQRKRVALLVALLEDRPIFIFDEWAADQDPHFRKHFYEEILPELRRQGKTIIAVTHDDHYFHIPNQIAKMNYGVIDYFREVDGSSPG